MSGRSVEELLRDATTYKDQGGALVREATAETDPTKRKTLFRRAASKYATVFAYTRGLPGSSRNSSSLPIPAEARGSALNPELERQAAELERVCHQNIAICKLSIEDAKGALEHIDKAIALGLTTCKCHSIRGQALLKNSKFDGKSRRVLNDLTFIRGHRGLQIIHGEERGFIGKEQGRELHRHL